MSLADLFRHRTFVNRLRQQVENAGSWSNMASAMVPFFDLGAGADRTGIDPQTKLLAFAIYQYATSVAGHVGQMSQNQRQAALDTVHKLFDLADGRQAQID